MKARNDGFLQSVDGNSTTSVNKKYHKNIIKGIVR